MLQVTSEIAPLETVLVHRPGEELLNLIPDNLQALLFDDIPYLEQAQYEHDVFTGLLRDNGAEVLYLENLMAETLAARPGLRGPFLREYMEEGGVYTETAQTTLMNYFDTFEDPYELVLKTMAGINQTEVTIPRYERSLSYLVNKRHSMLINPMPNLYFTRDPFTAIGTGGVINRMSSVTRNRETLYTDYIMRFHPRFEGTTLYYERDNFFNIEGGDIFNLSDELITVGTSQRTSPEAIEELATELFFRHETPVETILAFNIPNTRAYMHLDTVFTQIDRDAFVYHPDIIGTFKVFELTRSNNGKAQLDIRERELTLAEALRQYLNLDTIRMIPCAGGDYVSSQREQWNDASNTLAIAPGKVIVYDRNRVTNQILREEGFTVLEMPSGELSRGRGGPRCMSMPLIRRA